MDRSYLLLVCRTAHNQTISHPIPRVHPWCACGSLPLKCFSLLRVTQLRTNLCQTEEKKKKQIKQNCTLLSHAILHHYIYTWLFLSVRISRPHTSFFIALPLPSCPFINIWRSGFLISKTQFSYLIYTQKNDIKAFTLLDYVWEIGILP